MIVLDTSAAIEILRETERGIKIVQEIGHSEASVTSISIHEVLVGAKEKEIPRIEGFLSSVETLSFDAKSAIESSRLQNKLKSRGIKIDELDIFIAGICLANGAKLITLDKDFLEIKELDVKVF